VKKKGKQGRPVRPDDYFAAGPIEFARFGNLTIGRSRATPQQWKAAQAEMAKRYPRVVAEIDALVETIATKVIVLSPSELLSHAHMEFIAFRLEIGDRKADGFDELAAARMVDYVQSVIAARAPQAPVSDLTEQAWDSLKEDIRTLFTRLALDYQHCLTAHRRAIDPHLDLDVEQFRFQLER
jgi:hypothetical protein